MTALSPRQRLSIVLWDSDIRFPFNPPYPPEYGIRIWETVLSVRPRVMIEFGVHRGYSTVVAALALEEAGAGKLLAYDNWEYAPGGGASRQWAPRNLELYGISHRVTLRERDFFEWIRSPEPCDLIYFDIHNDGDKVLALYEGVKDQIDRGTIVLFEGGTEERDRHPTMAGRAPINAARNATGYEIVVRNFPSLSRISRNRI